MSKFYFGIVQKKKKHRAVNSTAIISPKVDNKKSESKPELVDIATTEEVSIKEHAIGKKAVSKKEVLSSNVGKKEDGE